VFRGLTERANKILMVDAQDEARRLNSEQLLPEHIVMAILKEGEGTACKALYFLRIDCEEFYYVLEMDVLKKIGPLVFGDLPSSKRTRRLLDAAVEEAKYMKDAFIGTEHLVLAALMERGSAITDYMNQHAVTTDAFRVILQTTFKSRQNNFSASVDEYYSFDEYSSHYYNPQKDMSNGNVLSGEKPSRSRSKDKKSLTPTLDEYTRDLTALAKEGQLDPVIGRTKEINRAIRILARRTKNNPLLIGEPGVGKTAIAEGLAYILSGDNAPPVLADRRILSLDLGLVVAGTKYRGEFEERLKKIMKEILLEKNIILFVDEIHTLVGAGGAEGTIDASNMLKPALSRGEIQCIGASTLREYRKYFERDAALDRRFQTIMVQEPDFDETIEIINGIKDRYETFHGVKFSDEAIRAAANLAKRYIPERAMPDKVIDILDETGAMEKLNRQKTFDGNFEYPEGSEDIWRNPVSINDLRNLIDCLESEIDHLTLEKERLVLEGNYEAASILRDKILAFQMQTVSLRNSLDDLSETSYVITEDDIRKVVSESTGIPVMRLQEHESKRLVYIENELHKTIVGQDEAISKIASSVRRSRSGISSSERPLGSFIFLGPTGVGKTLLAKALAEYLFGSKDALIRIDMSDFMEKHNVSRLVGAPPGYVGYEEGGILTEQIRRNPYRVILFDEIEKAHRDVFNLLLQVLEEGELKDNLGHTVSFRNTLIIMTSNAGAREITMDSRIGFKSGNEVMNTEDIRSAALAELKKLFNPEFINRVDDVVVFHALNQKQIEAIFDLQLEDLLRRVSAQGFTLKLTHSAKRLLVEKGWDPKYGARPMRRTIQKELEDPLALLLLGGVYPLGSVFNAEGRNGKIHIRYKPVLNEIIPPNESNVSGTEKRSDAQQSFVAIP
jgi:ATP-dependent Clp protease ATP-binding subunit ClpC